MNAITNHSSSTYSGGKYVSLLLMLRPNIHQGMYRSCESSNLHTGSNLRGHMAYGDLMATISCCSCSVRRSCKHLLTYEPTCTDGRSSPHTLVQGHPSPKVIQGPKIVNEGLHAFCLHKIHKLRKYLVVAE